MIYATIETGFEETGRMHKNYYFFVLSQIVMNDRYDTKKVGRETTIICSVNPPVFKAAVFRKIGEQKFCFLLQIIIFADPLEMEVPTLELNHKG